MRPAETRAATLPYRRERRDNGRPPPNPCLVMNSDLLDKLDARGRHELLDGGLASGAEIMVRTHEPLSAGDRDDLAGAGFESHFAAGNIASGAVVDRECLEAVASLPFVARIEVSRPMFAEQHGP